MCVCFFLTETLVLDNKILLERMAISGKHSIQIYLLYGNFHILGWLLIVASYCHLLSLIVM